MVEDFRFKSYVLKRLNSAAISFYLHGFHWVLSNEGTMAINFYPMECYCRGEQKERIRTKLQKTIH